MEISRTASCSIVGKPLEEISWEKARDYRTGGQGRENVLTAEVLVGLDFLPGTEFLGGVFRTAHGASEARAKVAAEAEELQMHFLPGDLQLGPGNRKGGPFVHRMQSSRRRARTHWSKPNEYGMEAFNLSNSLANM